MNIVAIGVFLTIAGTASAQQLSKPLAIYALTPPAGSTELESYTTNLATRDTLLFFNWTLKGIVGYVHETTMTSTPQGTALKQLKKGAIVQYALQGSPRYNALTTQQQYVEVTQPNPPDFAGFMFASATSAPATLKSIPLYALRRSSDGKIRLTTKASEINPVPTGYVLDNQGSDQGLVGYVPVLPYRLSCPPTQPTACNNDGLSIVIHGGGWADGGREPPPLSGIGVQTMAAEMRWFARGWATVAISYRTSAEGPNAPDHRTFNQQLAIIGGFPYVEPTPAPRSALNSVEDTQWFFERRSEILGATLANKKTCAVGFSAGGHLALMLAANNHSIRCVVSDSAAIDLATAPVDKPTPANPNTDPHQLSYVSGGAAQWAFGTWWRFSDKVNPNVKAYAANVKILLGGVSNDLFVGIGHINRFNAALDPGITDPMAGRARAFTLNGAIPGSPSVFFVHSDVTQDSYNQYRAAEHTMASEVESSP